jgi:hypothetical protein
MNNDRGPLLIVGIIIILCIVAVVVLNNCSATMQQRTYQTLSVSQTSYDAILTKANQLYQQGKITDEQKDKIISLGRVYMNAHNTAVDYLLLYEQMKASKDQIGTLKAERDYLNQMAAVSLLLADFIDYATPLIGGK